MEQLRVQIYFSGERDAELGATGGTIIAHMAGNAHFTELAPDVTKLQTAHVAYIKSLEPGPRAGSLAKAVKDECRKALEAHLHDLGQLINFKAKGNQPVLESTGYPLVSIRGGSRRRKGIRLESGANKVAVSFPRVARAGAYVVEYTEVPVTADSRWEYVVTKVTSVTVTGLLTGHKYAFKVAGIIDDGAPVFSEPVISRFVE